MPERGRRIIPFPLPPALAATGLQVEGIRLEREGNALLDGTDLALSPHGISALMGPNGAGKTLLLRVIAGLETPEAGEVRMPAHMRGRVGLVFQRPVLLRRSLRGNLTHALRLARVPRQDRNDRLAELLELGQLDRIADRPARRLSGGEAQRLAIVRALARRPALLLVDEPTAHLDPRGAQAVEALLGRIARDGTKVVLVSHDTGQVSRIAAEVAFLHRGRCREVTPMPAFLSAPQSAEARAYLEGSILL
ncbi:ATP-binding cassette domain-containing protein [Rhodobacterales bacterium HKCCE3408]|nr:ATP-binding cassette domain-containing protein [Rhodobacterales bacterium HKCCE3408]